MTLCHEIQSFVFQKTISRPLFHTHGPYEHTEDMVQLRNVGHSLYHFGEITSGYENTMKPLTEVGK